MKKHIANLSYYFKAFFLNCMVAAIAIVPFIIIGHGTFAMSNDFIAENIPFGMFVNNAFKEGKILYNYNIDLGANFFESLNGYATSPFILVQLLFPAKLYPYVVGWVIILKYGVAGLTSSLFLNRYIKDEWIVLLGSLLYSFSSFQCTTIIFQFQDIVAVFPLMLYSLELLYYENRRFPFVLASAVNMMCAFSFFVEAVLFLVIYYICIYLIPDVIEEGLGIVKKHVVKATQCILYALIGCFAVAWTFFPVIANLVNDTRANDKLAISNWFTISTGTVLLWIKTFFLPAEPMNNYFSVVQSDWMSNAAYLPLFGLTLCIAYIITKRSDKWKNLIIVLLLFSIIPVANNSFYLFTSSPYHRWYHMLVMVEVLVTSMVLKNCEQYKWKKAMLISISILLFFYLIIFSHNFNGSDETIIYYKRGVYISVTYVILGTVLLYLFLENMKSKVNKKISTQLCLLLAVFAFCTFQLAYVINQYQSNTDNTGIDFLSFDKSYSEATVEYITDVASKLPRDIGPYRYYFSEGIGYTYYNIAMTNSLPSINSFISSLPKSVFDFYSEIGSRRGTMTIMPSYRILDLLGVKSIIASEPIEQYEVRDMYENENGQEFYLLENTNALPIGFSYDTYMTKSEFDLLTTTDSRINAMISAMVVEDEKGALVSEVLEHYQYACNEADINQNVGSEITKRQENVCVGLTKSTSGFSAEYSNEKEGYVCFTIPYEKWWKASINGREVPVLDINGFMAIQTDSGDNNIEFIYDYAPIKYAAICSLIFSILSIGFAVSEFKRVRKQIE